MWSEAERVVAEAERNDPKDLLWKRMQAKMYSARGLHERAALKIREALVADSRNGELLKDYLDILETGRMWPQLLAETERVFSTDREVVAKGWWAYVKRAVALSNLDRKQEGMADFVKALEIVQSNRTTLDNEKAIVRVATMLAKSSGPEASRWRVVLAYLYLQTGEFERATTLVKEALDASNMDEANTLTGLHVAGNVYMASGKYEPARAVYEQVLTKTPDDLGALNNLACIMAEHTDVPNLPKALEYSQRAVAAMTKANRQDPSVLDTVGWMNVLAGGDKLAEGIDYLVSSIKAGEIAEAQYHLGEAYLKKNLPANAKTSLMRARELISEKKQAPDEILKKRIEDALVRVEKALLEARASNP
jgi:tetratricopeptide (TPR) repeat protein